MSGIKLQQWSSATKRVSVCTRGGPRVAAGSPGEKENFRKLRLKTQSRKGEKIYVKKFKKKEKRGESKKKVLWDCSPGTVTKALGKLLWLCLVPHGMQNAKC
jgi:hypothetical protein